MFILDFPIEEVNQRVRDHRRRAERIITGVDLAQGDSQMITYTTTTNAPADITLGSIFFDIETNNLSIFTADGLRSIE